MIHLQILFKLRISIDRILSKARRTVPHNPEQCKNDNHCDIHPECPVTDSGRTLSYLLENLKSRKPKSLRLCTLLDKPERRVTDVQVDYTGFEIPDKFVVGYGLDYMQRIWGSSASSKTWSR